MRTLRRALMRFVALLAGTSSKQARGTIRLYQVEILGPKCMQCDRDLIDAGSFTWVCIECEEAWSYG